MRGLKLFDEPGQPGKINEYLRDFDKSVMMFAGASLIKLAGPALVLWYWLTFNNLVATYGWGHVPPSSLPISSTTTTYVYEALYFIGHVGWLAAFYWGMFSARKYAEALGIDGYQWSYRWTFISLFIPILNLVRPWLGFGEIRRSIVASHRDKTLGQVWQSDAFSLSTFLLPIVMLLNLVTTKIASDTVTISEVTTVLTWLFGDVCLLAYFGCYLLSLRPSLIGLRQPEPQQRSVLKHNTYDGSNDEVWRTYLNYDPAVRDTVGRLSLLSSKNVDEFRSLLVRERDANRLKEFEDEAIRRVQGHAFVTDVSLRETYIKLNDEDRRLGDELVKVVAILGRPKDLEWTISQMRQNLAKPIIFDPFDDIPAGSKVEHHFRRRVAFLPDGSVFGVTNDGPRKFGSFEEWQRFIEEPQVVLA